MLSHILMTVVYAAAPVLHMHLLRLAPIMSCIHLVFSTSVHKGLIFFLVGMATIILLYMVVTTVGGTKITNTQQQSQGQSQR